jgi:hypothetical protein
MGPNTIFKKNSRKIQDGFAPILLLSTPLRWLKRVLGLIPDANSKTGMRAEQSEWSRKTTTSVEVTVETDEAILFRAADRQSSEVGSAEGPDRHAQAKIRGSDLPVNPMD